MESFRTFTMYGTSESNTSIQVMVDGVICKNGVVEGNNLFSFQNNVKTHGKVEVKIQVNSGSITLGKTMVTYPTLYAKNAFAKYNKGTITFPQPFQSKYVFNSGILTKFDPNTITIKDHFQFDHVTFNGPNNFLLLSENDLEPNLNLDNFYFYNSDDSKNLKILPIYNYKNVYVSWSSKQDNLKCLDILLTEIYGTFGPVAQLVRAEDS